MITSPILYNTENLFNSSFSPGTVHTKDSRLYRYFFKYLLQEAMGVFKWELPDGWNRDFFLYNLYLRGYIGVFKTDKYGVIPCQCSLSGVGLFYQPTDATLINPLINNAKAQKIDIDCVLFKLQPDYSSVCDIIAYYADLMSLTSESIATNILNSKNTNIFKAKSQAQANSIKKAYDDVSSGQPAVVVDKSLFDDDAFKPQSIAVDYMADKLNNQLQQIINEFHATIGISNVSIEKRERLLSDEINANNQATLIKSDLWLEELQKSCKLANTRLGVDISVTRRYEDVNH